MSATVVLCDESEEQAVGSSTRRFTLIAMLYTHLVGEFHRDFGVRVACHRWVDPNTGVASSQKVSDVRVAFGWSAAESGVFPQVVFEVWSPNNRYTEMQNKFAFYEKHGAEEYYILYPEFPMHAEAFRREAEKLVSIPDVHGYVSPRTGLRFALETGQLTVFGRDGHPLRTAEEQVAAREAAEQRAAARAAKLQALGVDPDAV
jgi:hypothetical protein